jgi:hypothetical protein
MKFQAQPKFHEIWMSESYIAPSRHHGGHVDGLIERGFRALLVRAEKQYSLGFQPVSGRSGPSDAKSRDQETTVCFGRGRPGDPETGWKPILVRHGGAY